MCSSDLPTLEEEAPAKAEAEAKIVSDKKASPTTGDLFVGLPEEAGLVMIETRSEKKAQFGDGAPEEPVRRGRKPKATTVIAVEPLQQVETTRD